MRSPRSGLPALPHYIVRDRSVHSQPRTRKRQHKNYYLLTNTSKYNYPPYTCRAAYTRPWVAHFPQLHITCERRHFRATREPRIDCYA
jgi:hypothetical protein